MGGSAGGLDIDVAYRSGFMMASMGIAYAGQHPPPPCLPQTGCATAVVERCPFRAFDCCSAGPVCRAAALPPACRRRMSLPTGSHPRQRAPAAARTRGSAHTSADGTSSALIAFVSHPRPCFPGSGVDGTILEVNPAFAAMLGPPSPPKPQHPAPPDRAVGGPCLRCACPRAGPGGVAVACC